MSRILSKIESDVLTLMDEESGGRFSSALIRLYINECGEEIYRYWNWDFMRRNAIISNVYTTCATGNSTGTTLYASSVAGMRAGQKLWVNDGSNFEQVQISSINSSTKVVTLVSPGLSHTYTSGDYISAAEINLPYDLGKLLDVRLLNISSSSQSGVFLIKDDVVRFNAFYPYQKGKAAPSHYYEGEFDDTQETGLTADSGTSATQIVDSALTGHEDNYYQGWTVINTNSTNKGTSFVKSYTYSTKTLTLEASVSTGQTTADTYYLKKNLRRLYLYPIPDAIYKFSIDYYKRFIPLINDSDSFDFGANTQDEFESAMLLLLRSKLLDHDKRYDEAIEYFKKYEKKMMKIKMDEIHPPGQIINIMPTERSMPGISFYD